MGVNVAVVPALRICAVDAEYMEMSSLNLLPDRVNHSGVLILVELALRRRKYKNRHSSVAIRQELHIVANTMAVPVVIIAAHRWLFQFPRIPSSRLHLTQPDVPSRGAEFGLLIGGSPAPFG